MLFNMSLFNHALNFTCLTLVMLSVGIFWSNKQLEREINQLTFDANILKVHLEEIHRNCKDKVVGAFPRIPATHVVTHNETAVGDLNFEKSVTIILLHHAEYVQCHGRQVSSIQKAFPRARILRAVVEADGSNVERLAGIYPNEAKALNAAIKKVNSPYFMVLRPNFIIEPKGSDTGVEWLHHALAITPGVDIIGGSVLLSNNELVVPCYSLNLCNWTITQKYEYERSFGEIMICNEVSHSFMARTDVVDKFNDDLFDENLTASDFMFIDFFLRAKKLGLTVANRPEVLFVQVDGCAAPPVTQKQRMKNMMPFSEKHQIMRFKNPENEIHSICDGMSKNACTRKKLMNDMKFPSWYDNGLFAFPFVIEQAIVTLETFAGKLTQSGIRYALRGETLFGAVMTKSILPWGRLNSIQLYLYATDKEVVQLAAQSDYVHEPNGKFVTFFVRVPRFSEPMKVVVLQKSDKPVGFVKVRVNGRLYPAPYDPIAELKLEFGESYLEGEDGKVEGDFSCKLEGHHACMPTMASRGASTYNEHYCEI